MIIQDRKKSVERFLLVLVSPNKVCWVADASVYTFMFVLYAGIVHVQCYRGWYVETDYVKTILGKLHKLKYDILTTHNSYLESTRFTRSLQRMESLFGGYWANSSYVRVKCPCQFSHGKELVISMYEEWWEKHAHADIFVAHCGFQVQY